MQDSMIRRVPWVTDMQNEVNAKFDRRTPTKHDVINKLTAVRIHLRQADTLCTSPGVIDEIRKADAIILALGDKLGVSLTDDMEAVC